jgi:serine/threonine protein kinase
VAEKIMMQAEVPETFGDYVRGRELGRGASGTVFTCERPKVRGTYAAKAIDLRRLRMSAQADRELKKLHREIDILRRVPPHENLVRFIDSFEEGNWCFLILEYVSGGDLFSVLVRRGRTPCFSEVETVFVLRQLVEGLSCLHRHGVIHRDLKLENVLVVRESRRGDHVMCTVKITDFGLSKVVGDGRSFAKSTVGSPRYIAPEVLAKGVHDFRADLWSLGVLLYVLLAGKFPFEGSPNMPQQAITAVVQRLEVSLSAQAVLIGLLQSDVVRRLPLDVLRHHAWLGLELEELTPAKRSRQASVDITESELFGSEDKLVLRVLASEESEQADEIPAPPATPPTAMVAEQPTPAIVVSI